MDTVTLREATAEDLPAINAIYDHYAINSTCTYQIGKTAEEARLAWFRKHGPLHPVVVAVDGSGIAGWGSLSAFHEREAYAKTVENSIYVRPDSLRKGIGSLILADLIDRAGRLGHHTIIAGIDSGQAASIALHSRFGFTEAGRLREVGFKFGRRLDVVYLQLILN
jgi:phosphinothricin acetyltransferase